MNTLVIDGHSIGDLV
jgi:transketolase